MVGPPAPGAEVDVRRRVLVCLSPTAPIAALTVALAESGFEVSEAGRLDSTAADLEPDDAAIVIFDDADPDWARLIADLVGERPRTRPVLLADLVLPELFLAAVTSGVAGFCRPDASVEAIVRTVEAVSDSGVAIPRHLVPPLVEHVRHGRGHTVQSAAGPIEVTDREWEILRLMMQHRSTREIADSLYVSTGTVRSHIAALLKKLGAVDRDDAIAMIDRRDRR